INLYFIKFNKIGQYCRDLWFVFPVALYYCSYITLSIFSLILLIIFYKIKQYFNNKINNFLIYGINDIRAGRILEFLNKNSEEQKCATETLMSCKNISQEKFQNPL